MRRVYSLAALSLLALAPIASAQRTNRGGMTTSNPSPELGVDAGLMFNLSGDPKITTFQFPLQRVRMGFFVNPSVSIEPSLGLTTISGGGEHLNTYDIGAGLLWHFSPSRAANQLYVRPFIDFSGLSTSGGSTSAFSFGGGFGVKMPLADRFATRLEGFLSHTGEHDGTDSSNQLGILFGLSVYTH